MRQMMARIQLVPVLVFVNVSNIVGSVSLVDLDSEYQGAYQGRATFDSNGKQFFGVILTGTSYELAIEQQPEGVTCVLNNNVGQAGNVEINSIDLSCSLDTYSIGGTLTGLLPGRVLSLQNKGSDDLQLLDNGMFSFAAELGNAESYEVTQTIFSIGQLCSINNGIGTTSGSDIVDIQITCSEIAAKPLNDSGVHHCTDYAYTDVGTAHDVNGSLNHNSFFDCLATGVGQDTDGTELSGGFDMVPGGQDALNGRDATHNDNSDGHAGFSFTKLDSQGQPLVDPSPLAMHLNPGGV